MSKKVWLSSNAYEFVNEIAYEQNQTSEQVVTDIILKKQCPMFVRCEGASHINCTDRDYESCDFYQKLLSEKERGTNFRRKRK